MAAGSRQKKYSSLLQKDLSEIFQKQMANSFGKAFITITDVEVSPDLSFAKVYLSLMLSDKPNETLERIQERKSEIRKHLGNRIGKQVRIIPELAFFMDETLENANRIDDILSKLDIPPEEEDEDDDENRD
ncbi:30S ribosome-binding factor RbfA [Marivirga harenae]|uniref:30S ribosome-binding factor RbfA n=1 Tax=Marivirga harenae TaxID=2010992 RepID=UPI0026DF81A9|nr:30S ribosome-binding factor RbfA [Marivirga harenae]WKV13526.1 30S ribosome-binding factor RbfA [Marivirga harenae]|tara:strand:+ start:156421 stop:156813 length:393 start_codon:yes stop_codon:yes gene_type:complete